jgi:hypothetical protein
LVGLCWPKTRCEVICGFRLTYRACSRGAIHLGREG